MLLVSRKNKLIIKTNFNLNYPTNDSNSYKITFQTLIISKLQRENNISFKNESTNRWMDFKNITRSFFKL